MLLFLLASLFINTALAAQGDVLINEIAWMGTDMSSADEWIELKNNTEQDIDITGWTLKAQDGTPDIALEGVISSQGYFLLERTDDNSVPDIMADQIYTGALSNGGEKLELYDTANNLIDIVDASENWLAGDNSTKQTMEKAADNTWQTSLNPLGTPKAQNSSGAQEEREEAPLPAEEPEEPPEQQPSGSSWTPAINHPPMAYAGLNITALINQEITFSAAQSSDPDNDPLTYFWNFGDGATDTQEQATHLYAYPSQYIVSLIVSDGQLYSSSIMTVNILNFSVIISEFMPNPLGPDEENEWIELYNQSDQIANLSDWQLDDEASGSPPFIFPAQTLIAPEQFLVIKRSISGLALNNDRDQVRLLYPDGLVASEISYSTSSQEGLAVAFDSRDYFWTKTPTPGLPNIISSTDLEPTQNLIANNPSIKQTNDLPTTTAQSDLESDNYSVLAQDLSQKDLLPEELEQSDPLAQMNNPALIASPSVANKQNANLILAISIIISASLFASWVLILWRRKTSHSKIKI